METSFTVETASPRKSMPAAADIRAGVEDARARLLLHRAIEARQRLADTEDALGKMAAGDFGRCEECGAFIADALLAAAPESRYCAGCTSDITAVTIAAHDITAGDVIAVESVAGAVGTGAGRR